MNLSLKSGLDPEKLYALARWDPLVGVPSTFAGWASYYGDVPLLELAPDTGVIGLASFRSYGS